MRKLITLCVALVLTILLKSPAYSELPLLERCTTICACDSPCTLRCTDPDDESIKNCGNYGLCINSCL